MWFSPLTVSTGWFDLLTEAEGWFDKSLIEYAASGAVTGDLSAGEAQDIAAFDGTGGTQSLHGRRVRGRRVIYPDELPAVIEAPKQWPEELPSLAPVAAKLAEAKAALNTAIKARDEAKRAKERAALEAALAEAQGRYNEAKGREDAIIRMLRDEDEFWLIAA